jgi:peptidoglycan hydrolase CwlO-like protein
MADPLNIASNIVALVTFALTSSVNLYTTIRNFQSQDKKARALKTELGDITTVLESLLETVNNN